jgi:predicted PP-loop superfamily ATPase
MAKQKEGVNKSQAVRELLTKNPTLTTKEIISTLAGQGIKVKPPLIYFVKGRMRGRKGRRRKAQREVASVIAPSGSSDTLSTVLKVKKLAVEVGGLGKLKALVEALSE